MQIYSKKRSTLWRGSLSVLCLACSAFAGGVQAQPACLQIEEIIVRDVTLFSEAQIKALTAPFENRCLGLDEFNEVLEAVTSTYVDAGYITSRAYLPEQDLADGSFEVVAVEGKIEGVTFNDEENKRWQRVVYPQIKEDHVANIREIEQGLDIIREMDSYQAEMELEAGEEAGQSVLSISAESERPWKITYSTNNYSQEPMGDYSSTLGVELDHLLGVNDQWSISYTKSMSNHPLNFAYDGFGTESLAASATFPYGPWKAKLSYNQSNYYQEIDGIFDPIPVHGWTQNVNLSIKRLMHRDQVSKTHLEFDLGRAEGENYIMDSLIESSSRILSTAKLTLSHERPLKGGTLSGALSYEQGLKLFGAEDSDKMPEGQPDAQFGRWQFNANYDRKWEFPSGRLGYNGVLRAQYSDDRLYGTQQFSLGGVSTTRGIMNSIATGSSGFLLRQEISYELPKYKSKYGGTPSFYAGLDYGQIFKDERYDIPFWQATGGVLGLRLKGGWLDLDISYARLVDSNRQSKIEEEYENGVWLISIKKEF